MMESIAYYNGTWASPDELTIPFLDRVCFFGDGIYDATIASKGVILFEEDHIQRFFNSAAAVGMEVGKTAEEISALLHEAVAKVSASDTFVYWQITRGTAVRNHAFPENTPVNFWIMVTPRPLESLDWAAKVICVEDTRFFHCNVKTLNLLPNVLAAQQAKEAGCDEAIFIRNGFVTECAHCNAHILKDGCLVTHPADNLILPGIGRAHLIQSCKRLGVTVQERPFTQQELMEADEVIISASSTFARAVCEVDGKPVGGNASELLSRIQHDLTEEFNTYIAERKHS